MQSNSQNIKKAVTEHCKEIGASFTDDGKQVTVILDHGFFRHSKLDRITLPYISDRESPDPSCKAKVLERLVDHLRLGVEYG